MMNLLKQQAYTLLRVKILPGRMLKMYWKELISHRPFDYHFLDDDYNKLYDSEMKLGKSLNIFTVIAILLACMGLFGLSAYAIQQRTKEIGIRKVLGASISNVVFLLSRD